MKQNCCTSRCPSILEFLKYEFGSSYSKQTGPRSIQVLCSAAGIWNLGSYVKTKRKELPVNLFIYCGYWLFDFKTLQKYVFQGRHAGKSVPVAKNVKRTTQPFNLVNLIYHPVSAPSFSSFILDQDLWHRTKPGHQSPAYEQVDVQMFASIDVPLSLGTG